MVFCQELAVLNAHISSVVCTFRSGADSALTCTDKSIKSVKGENRMKWNSWISVTMWAVTVKNKPDDWDSFIRFNLARFKLETAAQIPRCETWDVVKPLRSRISVVFNISVTSWAGESLLATKPPSNISTALFHISSKQRRARTPFTFTYTVLVFRNKAADRVLQHGCGPATVNQQRCNITGLQPLICHFSRRWRWLAGRLTATLTESSPKTRVMWCFWCQCSDGWKKIYWQSM